LVNVSSSSGAIAIGPYSVLVLSRQAHPDLDADGDGLRNGWEQTYFGDPLAGVATADNDNDGLNNFQEQAADTHPTQPGSVLKFTRIQSSPPNVTLDWTGGQAARQVIQRSTNATGPWTGTFTNNPPTVITNSLLVPNATNASSFFRILIQ
jgi:hypothetical protein